MPLVDYLREIEGKTLHDHHHHHHFHEKMPTLNRAWSPGPVIVGAGPSGLAAAACLQQKGIPSLVIERSDSIASLWKYKTYDRLRLHLPKQFCELPFMSFPPDYPTYPTKQEFISYLDDYAQCFNITPVFNRSVVCAEFDSVCGFWRIRTVSCSDEEEIEYVSKWLIVATGENAENFVPEIEGMSKFKGSIVHSSAYKTGEAYRGKHVLVVGCGNSGMEVCLDLCNYHAQPSLSVRDSVHVLPQEMLGMSTFGLSTCLRNWFPIVLVDKFLLLISRLVLGDTAQLGITRPKIGPLELKGVTGKTPVLDIGTLEKIRTGKIKVCKGIKKITSDVVEFVDARVENFDDIILATGYKSNVPTWLKETNFFSDKDGFPRKPFPHGWKGENGLYAVGFSKHGLLGTSMDSRKIAEDVDMKWNATKNNVGTHQFTKKS